MGYPIPYGGVLPKLLITAAISMTAIRDFCTSLLDLLGIPSGIDVATLHHHPYGPDTSPLDRQPSATAPADPRHHSSPLPQQCHWYFNPHLHTPSDHRLLLPRSRFCEAVQASLPAVLYGSLPLEQTSPCIPPLPSASSASSSLQITPPKPDVAGCVPQSSAMRTSSSFTSLPLEERAQCLRASSAASHPLTNAYISDDGLREQETESPTTVRAPSTYSREALNHSIECAVCLCGFETEQEVSELPLCRHIFHKDCVDGWILHNRYTCPLCRSSLLTPTMALQEMLREQERLSHQLISWYTLLQEKKKKKLLITLKMLHLLFLLIIKINNTNIDININIKHFTLPCSILEHIERTILNSSTQASIHHLRQFSDRRLNEES